MQDKRKPLDMAARERMTHLGVWFPIMVALTSLLASRAHAETETQLQVTARTNVEVRAAQVGVAPTEAQAVKDQATLMPAVKEAVKAGATKSLLEHTTNPSVDADLLRLAKVAGTNTTTNTGISPRKKPSLKGKRSKEPAQEGPVAKGPSAPHVAHAAGCTGAGIANYEEFAVAPEAVVGWIYIREQGWCYNGYSMTWLGGSFGTQWSWGPFCWTGLAENYSWDVEWSWVHMARWGSLGISYPWGCGGLWGGKVPIRIAANGYWDFYNDYGF